MKKAINAIRFILSYGVLLMAVVEILEFAIKKLEGVKLPKRSKPEPEIEDIEPIKVQEGEKDE